MISDNGPPDKINELKDVGIHLKVFPNPTKNELNISVNGLDKGKITLKLLNLEGELLRTKQIKNKQNEKTVNLNDFPSGIYLLKAKYGEKLNIYKIVKQ